MHGLRVSSDPVAAACTELSPLAAALPTSVTFRQTGGAVLPHSAPDVSFGMRHRKRGKRSRLFLVVTLVDDRIVREASRLLALLLGDLLGLLDELVLFAQPTLSLSIFCLGHASPIPGDLALKPLWTGCSLAGHEKTRRFQRAFQSGHRDLNSGPLVPQSNSRVGAVVSPCGVKWTKTLQIGCRAEQIAALPRVDSWACGPLLGQGPGGEPNARGLPPSARRTEEGELGLLSSRRGCVFRPGHRPS